MVLLNSHGHGQYSGSDQFFVPNDLDQSLKSIQSSSPSVDSVESQQTGLLYAPAPDLWWFREFILYDDSDDPKSQADASSVLETSRMARVDTSSSMTVGPLLPLSSDPDPVSTDFSVVASSTDIYRWLNPTGSNEQDLSVDYDSNMPNSDWNTTDPASDLYASSHSDSTSGVYSEHISPDYSMPTQNDMAHKSLLPPMHYPKCTTCQALFSTQARLRFVPQVYTSLSVLTSLVNIIEHIMHRKNSFAMNVA